MITLMLCLYHLEYLLLLSLLLLAKLKDLLSDLLLAGGKQGNEGNRYVNDYPHVGNLD